MILFAMAAGGGVSIGQLFMGGLIPGILLGVALMIITAIIARKRNYPKGRVMSLKEIWKATKDALLGLMTCIIIVGGVIPHQDYDELYRDGAAAIFGPGTPIATAAIKILEILLAD